MAFNKDLTSHEDDWELQGRVDSYLEKNWSEIQGEPQKLLDELAVVIGTKHLVSPKQSALEPAIEAVGNRVSGTFALTGEKGRLIEVDNGAERAKKRVVVVNEDNNWMMEYGILTGEEVLSGPLNEYPEMAGQLNMLTGEQFDKFRSAMTAVFRWNQDELAKEQ